MAARWPLTSKVLKPPAEVVVALGNQNATAAATAGTVVDAEGDVVMAESAKPQPEGEEEGAELGGPPPVKCSQLLQALEDFTPQMAEKVVPVKKLQEILERLSLSGLRNLHFFDHESMDQRFGQSALQYQAGRSQSTGDWLREMGFGGLLRRDSTNTAPPPAETQPAAKTKSCMDILDVRVNKMVREAFEASQDDMYLVHQWLNQDRQPRTFWMFEQAEFFTKHYGMDQNHGEDDPWQAFPEPLRRLTWDAWSRALGQLGLEGSDLQEEGRRALRKAGGDAAAAVEIFASSSEEEKASGHDQQQEEENE